MKKQSSIIKEQNARLQVQTTRIQNHEMTITEIKKKFEELQANLVEIKSKLEFDTCQNVHVPPTATWPYKDPTSDVESSAMSSNLRRMIQYETMRQKTNILRKINNRGLDKPAMNKPRSPKLKVEEAKRRRFKSMVDVDIWRHRCPTSKLSYSLWQRNYSRPKPNKLEMPLEKEQPLNIAQPSTSDSQKNTKRDFVYKSVIKQRASRVFPLSCLELERKRKSSTRPDIPTKLSKIEANSALKSLEIINKYFPLRHDVSRSEVTKDGCNVLPRSISTKRKRDLGNA
ncbi:hypothetical protein HHI36_020684 [Cryptolaemus montrouzieri]|uniref:Uncharacterized protein n=1 Tax=Cryptolaemus montrouzieri TaxID=559131 RepID=A0ABD2NBS8_9CUCU